MEPGGRGAHFLAGPYPNLNGANDLNGHSNVSRWAGRVFRPWRPFRNCKTLKGLKSCEKMEHKGQRSRIRAAQHRSLGRPSSAFRKFLKIALATSYPVRLG